MPFPSQSNDFRLNQNKYLDLVLTNALQAIPNSLATGNLRNGQTALIHASNQLERLCLAMDILKKDDAEYLGAIEAERVRLNAVYPGKEDRLNLHADLADYRVGLLEERIMANKTLWWNGKV